MLSTKPAAQSKPSRIARRHAARPAASRHKYRYPASGPVDESILEILTCPAALWESLPESRDPLWGHVERDGIVFGFYLSDTPADDGDDD